MAWPLERQAPTRAHVDALGAALALFVAGGVAGG